MRKRTTTVARDETTEKAKVVSRDHLGPMRRY